LENDLKAAVIGCGGAGQVNHIPWYSQNKDVELVGLVDTNIDLVKKNPQWKEHFFTDPKEMLEKVKPDLVSIASPVHLHCEHALLCMDYGCHVLCEKPMAPSLAECQKMIDKAAKKNLTLGLALDKRFSTVFGKARELIQSGQIGQPLFVRSHLVMNQYWVGHPDRDPGFRGKLYTGGGAFQDLGSHYLDISSWLLDEKITAIYGQIDICCPEQMEVEDQATALITFEDGTKGLIECSWVGPMDQYHAHIEEMWIYGTDGAIKVLGAQRIELPNVGLWDRKKRQWQLISLPCDLGQFSHYQYKRMVDEFVACVKDGRRFFPDGEDGKRTIECVLGAYLSSYTGEKVALPLQADPPLAKIFEKARKQS